MSCSSCFFLKYFAVFWLAFSDAQLQPPSDGSVIVLNSGETKSITWRYNGVVPKFNFKTWYFSGVDGRKFLAKIDSGGLQKFQELNIDFRIIEPFTLVLRNVNETYNGTYIFTVLPLPRSETSEVDVLIAVPPTIDVNCSDTTTLNASASFSCQCIAKNGNPPVNEVKWYNGTQVLSSGREMAILKIEQANRFGNGQYRCEAMGHEKAKAEKTIELIVNYKPVNVRLNLQREGDKATLTCTAEGNPPPRYEIFVNGSISVMNGSTLVINEVTVNNIGVYTCRATNILGSLSRNVNLPLKDMSTTTSSPAESDPNAKKGSEGGLGGGVIAGIVIGVLVVIIIIVIVVYFCVVKKNKDNRLGNSKSNAEYSKAADSADKDTHYAALDPVALNAGGSRPRADEPPPQTQYASIDHGATGSTKADLV